MSQVENISHSAASRRRRVGWFPKVVAAITAAVLLPPFVMLAMAPMILFMVPIAICGVPFILSAFLNEAAEVPQVYSVRVLRPVHA